MRLLVKNVCPFFENSLFFEKMSKIFDPQRSKFKFSQILFSLFRFKKDNQFPSHNITIRMSLITLLNIIYFPLSFQQKQKTPQK